MQRFKVMQPFARLPIDESSEQFAFDIFTDQAGHGHALVADRLGVDVLDDDVAVAQVLEFLGIERDGLVAFVAVWEEEFCSTVHAGALFGDLIDFALPAAAEH